MDGRAKSAVATGEATPGSKGDAESSKRGKLRIFHRTLTIVTESRVVLRDVTAPIREMLRTNDVEAGMLTVSTPHTTAALFVGEAQSALLSDIEHFLSHLAPPDAGYLHNCEDCSDCERKNAQAHMQAMLLGHQVTLPICAGEIGLGQWQSILFAELDGPRERSLIVQALGM